MEPLTQNQITENVTRQSVSKTTLTLTGIFGILVIILISGYIGAQLQQQAPTTQTNTTNITPTATSYVAPVTSETDLNNIQTSLDNTDPNSLTTNLSQNDTDSQSF